MSELNEKNLLMRHGLARALKASIGRVYTHAAQSAKTRIPANRMRGLLRFDLNEVLRSLENKEMSST